MSNLTNTKEPWINYAREVQSLKEKLACAQSEELRKELGFLIYWFENKEKLQ